MIKKTALLMSLMLIAAFAGGCWNYRGLNEMTIIVGMAIDRRETGEGYRLTFEAVDLSAPVKTLGIKHQLIESEGKTLFDAVRNAKRRNQSKLYFGHMTMIMLNQDIARNDDLEGVIDWFLRDSELRETLCFAISQEATADKMLSVQSDGNPLVSLELDKILDTDNQTTSSTVCVELYDMYNILKSEGISLVLPMFHAVENADRIDAEADGTAVFKGGKMIGELSPEETKYFLFATGKAEGGVLTFSSKGNGSDDTSLEISQNRTNRSFTIKDGKPVVTVKTDTDVFLDEYKWSTDDLDKQEILSLQSSAQQTLAHRIGDVISKVQKEYGSDIFGFGSMIHKQDPALWNKLKGSWDATFPSLQVVVECKINIVNTAAIKE